jgi:hypothetical protein
VPEIRHFIVTQIREVKVWANDPVGAAEVADAAFNDRPGLSTPGEVRSEVREIGLTVTEDR